MAAVEAVLATEEKTFLAVALRHADIENPTADDLYAIGTKAVIKKMARSPAGIELLVQGVERVALCRSGTDRTVSQGEIPPSATAGRRGTEVEALHRASSS